MTAQSLFGKYRDWETAGSIRGGRVVFGSLALERETVLDPSGVADKVKTYLLINTSDKAYQYVVRTNPTDNTQTDVLGVVGERYHVLQNEDLFSFGDNILDGGGRWETAGSIRGGRVVFGSMALERETVLDPNGVADKVKTYLLINTSHDGSIAIRKVS